MSFFVTNFRILCKSPLVRWKALSSCHVGSGSYARLKGLIGLTTLLPDVVARSANDECRSGSGSLATLAAIRRVPRKPHINHGYLDYGTKLRRGTSWQCQLWTVFGRCGRKVSQIRSERKIYQ